MKLITGHSYGTLLGSEVFQTFIGGIVAFRVLPRPSFSVLQQSLFPIYFAMQTALAALLALTHPSSSGSDTLPLFATAHDTTAATSFSVILVCGFLNWFLVGPATVRAMRDRKVQETRDGKKYYDPGPKSEAMKLLNKRFGALHGLSTVINLMALGATIYYGFMLGSRL